MGWVILTGVLLICLTGAWLVLRHPVRQVLEEVHFDRARILFAHEREWLEARFLTALAKVDPLEAARWDDAHWQDEIVWAREHKSRRLLALIGVRFDSDLLFDPADEPPRHATAVFEFRKGHWRAEGKRLDEVQPDEAFLRLYRLEPIVPHPRRV